jgi:hypothetical protein
MREMKFWDYKIATSISDKDLLRDKIYKSVAGVHLLLLIVSSFLVSDGNRSTYFLFLNAIFISFYTFAPNRKSDQSIEIAHNKLKRTHATFPIKSTFELEQVNEVSISQEYKKSGRTVCVNYGLGQNRHNLMDSLSLEDAEKVKIWVEGKLN